MLELIAILSEKRLTPTRAITLASAECFVCGAIVTLPWQNLLRHNKRASVRCMACPTLPEDRKRARQLWAGMRRRCENPRDPSYAAYGGRGIYVCDDWGCFDVFWADMGSRYQLGLSLERKDVNGPYAPWNCRWASMAEQQANKRTTRRLTYRGQDLHLAELCRSTGLSRGILSTRLNQGLSADEAVAAARASTYKKNRRPRTYTTS